jgi:SAM-dependent methyltransferase
MSEPGGLRGRIAALLSGGGSKPQELPDEVFLRSAEYPRLMAKHLPYDRSHDLHEAQNETRNYRFRHKDQASRLGVFRWRGIEKHLSTILQLVASKGSTVVDFGGAGGPLGLGSILVDQLKRDRLGRPVPYHSLQEVPKPVDVVFSSHTLEHIPDLDSILAQFAQTLRRDGHLLLHLPAFSCERWRAGKHDHKKFNPHVWTFGIGPKPGNVECEAYLDIAERIRRWFDIEMVEYCGDDSIFLHGRPRRIESATLRRESPVNAG